MEVAGVGGRTILKCILRKEFGKSYWIDLAEDRDSCRAFVNSVMNVPVPSNTGNF
jgi:hypothetical protein